MNRPTSEGVEVVVTHLEMTERPTWPRPPVPPGPVSALVAADAPPAWYFLALHDAVGRDYGWTDRHAQPREELERYLADRAVTLYTFVRAGWPHGFFVLDGRAPGVVDLSYFGLVPEAIGRGLGRFLLGTAVHMAWDRPGCTRLTVDTNSLDHPRALPLYQKAGFVPVWRRTERRMLPQGCGDVTV